jgi:hypothetical protein
MLNLNMNETYQEAGDRLMSRIAKQYQLTLAEALACGAISEDADPTIVARHVLVLVVEKLNTDKRFLANLRNFI